MFDLAIIGAGPAGLSAAIHASRFKMRFVLIEKERLGGAALSARWIENYPGFPKGIDGKGLMSAFIEHAKRVTKNIKKAEVTKVSFASGRYILNTPGGDIFAKSVILAAGLEPLKVGHFEKTKVYYYPDPDSLPHDGKHVLVIGGGDCAFDLALSFSKRARIVTIAMRSEKPKALDSLVSAARKAGIKIKKGLSEGTILKMRGDVVVACIGKIRRLDILEESLRSAVEGELATRTYLKGFLQLAGDVAHPNIRHIGPAVGDGIEMVERIITCR